MSLQRKVDHGEHLGPLLYQESLEHVELINTTSNPEDSASPEILRGKVEGSKYSGWKLSLTLGSLTSFLVLVLNVCITIWSTARPEFRDGSGRKRGLKILQEGPCTDIKRTDTVIHLFINIFNTILLAASNHCMQCLSAPTRNDVDKAHWGERWVDIGVPSVRNLFEIPRIRVALWFLLLSSSYRCTYFFASITTMEYEIYSIQDTSHRNDSIFSYSFAQINSSNEFRENGTDNEHSTKVISEIWERVRKGQMDNLTSYQCINAYATAFQVSHKHLIIVTEKHQNEWKVVNPNFKKRYDNTPEAVPIFRNSSSFHGVSDNGCGADVYDWICYGNSLYLEGCNATACHDLLPGIKKDIGYWAPYDDDTVKYCLSQPVPQHCKLYFSTYISIFLIFANAVKVCVILYTTCYPPQGLLLVLGDAIQSFLTRPDTVSVDSCLVSSDDIKHNLNLHIVDWAGQRQWYASRRRWAAAVSLGRWATGLFMYLTALTTTLFLLVRGIRVLPGKHDITSLWQLGLGTATESTLIGLKSLSSDSGVFLRAIILANLPQLCFSFLYFQYNGVFTAMLAAKEWSDFGRKRRGLRVASDPRGNQRSQYFLQLPYRWSIPLRLGSTLIHWLLSQSVFIVAIESDSGTNLRPLFVMCGYSPAAIILTIGASIIMVFSVVYTGTFRLPTSIPLVGSCSLAIAAACHCPNGISQPDAPLLPLKWGVMQRAGEGAGNSSPGHCGFSSEDVGEPVPGVEYS